MNLKYYIKRIINDRLKLCIIIFLMLIPMLDIVQNLNEILRGGSAYSPHIMTFLSSTIFRAYQMLMLWYLPIYLLILVGDDCIKDFKLGYKNILISKMGRNGYFFSNILKGFIISFSVILLSLMLNYAMSQIAFYGAYYYIFDENTINKIDNLRRAFEHPVITNLMYIALTSFISGIVGMGAVAVSILLHNRFLVYPVVFFMWYLPFALQNSIMYALQPFTEYSIKSTLPTLLLVFAINFSAIIAAYISEASLHKHNFGFLKKR